MAARKEAAPHRPWVTHYVDKHGKRCRKGTRGAKTVRVQTDTYYVWMRQGGKSVRVPLPLTLPLVATAASDEPRPTPEGGLPMPAVSTASRMLSTREACAFLGVCNKTLLRWHRQLLVRRVKLGRLVRWPLKELEDFIAARTNATQRELVRGRRRDAGMGRRA
jgi:excisionase family DNA binding protein